MKLSDALDTYMKLATKASDVARQLCFAGIGIIWLFKVDHPGGIQKLPHLLLIPSLALAAALLCDFLQYAYGTVVWGRFHDRKEHEYGIDADSIFYAPKSMIAPMGWLFSAKLSLVSVAYAVLLGYLGFQLV